MAHVRLAIAIMAGKLAGWASRMLGRGGGTNLPGVVARRIEPATLQLLCKRLPHGVILVAGTNGKTTTTRMLAACLQAGQQRLVHNRAGANLVSGLTATALAGSSLFGTLDADIGLFEVDEAAFPQALAETQPRLVVLHNLFRDQLDRYGEVDTIATQWRAALATLPADSVVLLNADDPAIAALGEGLAARVVYYGLEDITQASESAAHVADSQFCRVCGTRYCYQPRFYAHIGHYYCPQCGLKRPQPAISLPHVAFEGIAHTRLLLGLPDSEPVWIDLPMPGLYNAINALAAAGAAHLSGIASPTIVKTLGQFSAAFGRIEHIDANGKPLLMALIKNPVGASETVRMLVGGREPHTSGLHLLILINDRDADGTDVSWLWDADFERLAGVIAHVVIGGTRAADMAVRLKYAGVDAGLLIVEPDPAQALAYALQATPAETTLYALPTYTAMLELRAVLAERGWVKPFWEE
jgi:lipid II isoglutaminyl synthase (glutamine-hydrolysing)